MARRAALAHTSPMQRLPILLALFAILAVLACGNKQPAPPPVDPSPPPAEPDPTEPAPTEPAPTEPGSDQSACAPTGCSSTVCAPVGEDVITTCEYRPEYDCYKQATCERQPGGDCGWTPNAELDACLAGARGQ